MSYNITDLDSPIQPETFARQTVSTKMCYLAFYYNFILPFIPVFMLFCIRPILPSCKLPL